MKSILINLISILIFEFSFPVVVQADSNFPPENDSGAVLCTPDVYFQPPGDCLPLGPSEILTEMARFGIPFPPQPLTAFSPDPGLNDLGAFHLS